MRTRTCAVGSKLKGEDRREVTVSGGRNWLMRVRGRADVGFTLIELMVVLVVVAILSTAIVPSMVGAIRQTGCSATASRIFDMLNFAHTAAVSRRRPVVVNFDPRVVWVSQHNTRLPWRLKEAQEVPERQTLISAELPEDVEIRLLRESETVARASVLGHSEAIRFQPDGTAENVLIEISDRTGNYYSVRIYGTSGEIELKEGQAEL